MIDRELAWDMELPVVGFEWREYDPANPHGRVIDFSSGYTFHLQFIRPRDNQVIHDKTAGIVGQNEVPNVLAQFGPDELKVNGLHGDYDVRLYAKRTSDGADRPFPRKLRFRITEVSTG